MGARKTARERNSIKNRQRRIREAARRDAARVEQYAKTAGVSAAGVSVDTIREAARRLWPSPLGLVQAALTAGGRRGLSRVSGIPEWALWGLANEYGVSIESPTGVKRVNWDQILSGDIQDRINAAGSLTAYAKHCGVSRQSIYDNARKRGITL